MSKKKAKKAPAKKAATKKVAKKAPAKKKPVVVVPPLKVGETGTPLVGPLQGKAVRISQIKPMNRLGITDEDEFTVILPSGSRGRFLRKELKLFVKAPK